MDKVAIFSQYRGLLFSIAYHMLGSAMDAEDMVQEVYLRWEGVENTDLIDAPRTYLTTIMTNLCISQLRLARVQRESYFGPWLPEPLLTESSSDPQEMAAFAETLSMAFLVMLEQCSPQERAAFLLRQVLDYDYPDIAAMLGKSEAACRQLVSRAKGRIQAQRHLPITPNSAEHAAMVPRFIHAITHADADGLMQLLAADCILTSDGGGKASAATHPLVGMDVISRFLLGLGKRAPANFHARLMSINGQPNLVGYEGEIPVMVIVLSVMETRIQDIYIVRNPDKLRQIPQWKEASS